MTTTAMLHEGKQANTFRRRQRVTTAITQANRDGSDLTVAAIARRAGVHRSFLYRHPDLLAQLHITQAEPAPSPGAGPAVSRASLVTDLANAQERNNRLHARVRQLERKLSETLGQQAWRESGLGTPDDIEQLKPRVVHLEQQVNDLTKERDECRSELDAARTANRQLMAQLNSRQA